MSASRAPQILIIDDELYYLEILTFILEAEIEADILVAGSKEGALELLRSNPSIDFIVCDDELPDGSGKEILDFLATSGRTDAPFILISESAREGDPSYRDPAPSGFIRKPFDMKTLATVLRNLMKSNRVALTGERSDYCRIRVSTLLRVGLLYQDLYLKLPNGKYLKVMQSGDPFDRSDADRFAIKKLEYLFIHRGDAEKFVASYLKNISQVSSQKDLTAEVGFSLSASTVEFIRDVSAKFGWSPALQKIAQQNIELSLKTLKTNPNLAELVARIETSSEEYFGAHSALTAFIACGISRSMEWSSDLTLFKLSMASLLHDITLTDGQISLARNAVDSAIENEAIFKDKKYSYYRDHPMKAAELLSSWEGLPPDVDTIILQHHERPDGRGFPHRLGHARIHPLSAVLIVAEDVVDYLFDKGKKADLSDFFSHRLDYYSHGQFKRIYNALVMDLSRTTGNS